MMANFKSLMHFFKLLILCFNRLACTWLET